MLYHYVFRTYKKKPLLEYGEIRSFLGKLFVEIAAIKGFQILENEILVDHVHLLIEQSYLLSTSFVMKNLKGISSRRIFQQYSTNRFEHRKLWGRSFYARKIKDKDEKQNVINYIKNQKDNEGIDKRY